MTQQPQKQHLVTFWPESKRALTTGNIWLFFAKMAAVERSIGIFMSHISALSLYSQGREDLLLLMALLYHFQRHLNLNQCFKRSLGFKSLRYLRRMLGLYWECARLNAASGWIDLPIIFFHRSLTPPLLGDCWLWWIGARGEHFPGLSSQWAWSELSVHVTADSFAVKSLHCEWPPQEARRNEGEKVSGKGGMCSHLIYRLRSLSQRKRTRDDVGWWVSRHAFMTMKQ